MKEFRVQVRIKNNLLLERREELSLSQRQIAKYIGISPSTYSALECMRMKPIDRTGQWTPLAKTVANFFQTPADEIWPDIILDVKKPYTERKVDCESLRVLVGSSSFNSSLPPDRLLMEKQDQDKLKEAIGELTPREQEVVIKRFGLNGEDECATADIADELMSAYGYQGVSRGRINQIEVKAIRKLRRILVKKKVNYIEQEI